MPCWITFLKTHRCEFSFLLLHPKNMSLGLLVSYQWNGFFLEADIYLRRYFFLDLLIKESCKPLLHPYWEGFGFFSWETVSVGLIDRVDWWDKFPWEGGWEKGARMKRAETWKFPCSEVSQCSNHWTRHVLNKNARKLYIGGSHYYSITSKPV